MKEKYVIYGAGKSAIGVASYCEKHEIPFKLLIKEKEKDLAILQPFHDHIIHLGDFLLDDYRDYTLVRSPGIPHFDDVIRFCYSHAIGVISEIEFAYYYHPVGKYILITGSNGKTTTATLLYEIFQAANFDVYLLGNIGDPLIDSIDKIKEDTYVILEISSFQLENTYSLRCIACVITNLTPNHLDHCINLDYYYRSKMKILELLEADGTFFYNIDDHEIANRLDTYKKTITYSLENLTADYLYDDGHIQVNKVHRFDVVHPYLIGAHNCYNVVCAFAIADHFTIPSPIILAAISSFHGIPYRLQKESEIRGIVIYNDSKSTTITSTLSAISVFQGKKIHLLLGGRSKHLPYEELKQAGISYYPFGEAKQEIAQLLNIQQEYDTVKDAFLAALEQATIGEVILFSPACSSFDAFKNFEERGQYFHELVNEVGKTYE